MVGKVGGSFQLSAFSDQLFPAALLIQQRRRQLKADR
jgi:hypothetical protein